MENNNGYWGDNHNQSQGVNQPNQFQPDPNQQYNYNQQGAAGPQYNYNQQYNYSQQGAGNQQNNYNQQGPGGSQFQSNMQYQDNQRSNGQQYNQQGPSGPQYNQQGPGGPQYNYNQQSAGGQQYQSNMQFQNGPQYNYNQQTAGNTQYNQQYSGGQQYNRQGSGGQPPKSGSGDNPGFVMGIIAAICGVFAAPAGIVVGIIGLLKSENNPKKLARYLNLAGIILGGLWIIGVIIWAAIFRGMMKSDSAAMYGNTEAKKVVERYFDALESEDKDQITKCFVKDYDYDLIEDLYGDYGDYNWDTEGISITKGETYTKNDIKKLSSTDYDVDIQEAYQYCVTCDYIHESEGDEIPGTADVEIIAVKSGGRYYILDVREVVCNDEDSDFAELDTEEDTEEATEDATEEDTEEAIEEDTEEDKEEIVTTEYVMPMDGEKYGTDELGYLTLNMDLSETSQFDEAFENASLMKGYANDNEDFIVGIVRYDNATKTRQQMATDVETTLKEKEGTTVTLSETSIGKDFDIPASKVSAITTDGVYASTFFFEDDGDLYVIQVVYAFQYFVEAETVVFTYEKP